MNLNLIMGGVGILTIAGVLFYIVSTIKGKQRLLDENKTQKLIITQEQIDKGVDIEVNKNAATERKLLGAWLRWKKTSSL